MILDIVIFSLTLVASLAQFWLAVVSWQGRPRPGAGIFTTLAIVAGFWSGTYVMVLFAEMLRSEPLPVGHFLRQIFVPYMPISYLLFVLIYVYPSQIVYDRRFVATMYTVPTLIAIWYIYTAFNTDFSGSVPHDDTLLPVLLAIAYGALVLGITLVARQAIIAPKHARGKLIALMMMGATPLLAEFTQMFIYAVSNVWTLELTPAASGIAALIGARAVLNLDLMDIMPVAYERVFSTMPEGIIVVNAQGRVRAYNDAALKLLNIKDTGDVMGRSWAELIMQLGDLQPSPSTIGSNEDAMRIYIAGRYLEISGQPISDRQSLPIGQLVMIRNVSSQVEAEDLRRDREQVAFLHRFIADISHDLFNSLAILNTSFTLLERAPVERHDHYLEQGQDQVQRIERILRDMLTITRLEDEAEIKLAPHSLRDILIPLAERYRRVAHEHGLQLAGPIIHEDHTIACDVDWLLEALERLLKNAIAYTHPGGTVTVQTGAGTTPNMLTITFIDTGTGIPPEDLPHIFERFFRGEAHRPLNVGSGLGLTIAQRVIACHGGSITVETQFGRGSTFTVTLPVLAQDDSANAPGPSALSIHDPRTTPDAWVTTR